MDKTEPGDRQHRHGGVHASGCCARSAFGTHALSELEPLIPSEQGREWLRRMARGRPLTTDNPTLYIFGASQIMSAFLHDEDLVDTGDGARQTKAQDGHPSRFSSSDCGKPCDDSY